jgi:PhzF family phenazine biosynthesis protein
MSIQEIPVHQVDAFTSEPFRGNPAAVCLLGGPRDAEWMQQVAAEMNLYEKAFLFRKGDAFELRWFTPAVEVPLCGHATLASAHVLWETGELAPGRDAVFRTKSGELRATRRNDAMELDFPAGLLEEAELPKNVGKALGVAPVAVRVIAKQLGEDNYLVELASESAVRGLIPNLDPLREPGSPGVIVTASSSGEYDFVSRYFVPWAGIDEDPVTGSAHCSLAPYWGERLGKTKMTGFQASARGGVVGVEIDGDRVRLTGQAITTLRGVLLC